MWSRPRCRVPADFTTVRAKLERRLAALQTGRAAETAVANDLARRGLSIVATNVRLGRLELDVVALDRDTVVVVEVRHRGGGAWQTGLASIAPAKAKRVRAAGERLWRERFLRDASVNRMRFDVAVVTFEPDGEARIEYALAVI
jgi:putative endonuclease